MQRIYSLQPHLENQPPAVQNFGIIPSGETVCGRSNLRIAVYMYCAVWIRHNNINIKIQAFSRYLYSTQLFMTLKQTIDNREGRFRSLSSAWCVTPFQVYGVKRHYFCVNGWMRCIQIYLEAERSGYPERHCGTWHHTSSFAVLLPFCVGLWSEASRAMCKQLGQDRDCCTRWLVCESRNAGLLVRGGKGMCVLWIACITGGDKMNCLPETKDRRLLWQRDVSVLGCNIYFLIII